MPRTKILKQNKIPGVFNLATSATLNAKVNEVKNEY